MSCCEPGCCANEAKTSEAKSTKITAASALATSVGAIGNKYADPELVQASVREYYGKQLETSKDLKTSACTACGLPPKHVRSALKLVPAEVKEKFYGCGNPIPSSIEGLRVLDLGSGSGRDCYVASLMVGPSGAVTGVDMTQEQLDVAEKHAAAFREKHRETSGPMTYKKGYIEDLAGAGIEAGAFDLAISNCVVNLSPNKRLVLEGVYRALRMGGEFYFSDVYCDRRLPQSLRKNELLFGECLAGALYINDFEALCREVGFLDPRVLTRAPIVVTDPELAQLCGPAKFYSITYRLFKLPRTTIGGEGNGDDEAALLEPQCEDYGQIAYYKGTIADQPFKFQLDEKHEFEVGRPALVCGNTAAMLEATYLARHFRVVGDRTTHFGAFDCSRGAVTVGDSSSGCCEPKGEKGSGGCC